jgi:hypothetical protein
MKFFVKVENGAVVGHPHLEENLKQLFSVEDVTDELAKANGFVRIVGQELPASFVRTGEPVFEIREDGFAHEVAPVRELSQDEKLELWVRRPRNFALANSDWTQMPDSPLSAEKKAEWAEFRQALREMTTVNANIQDPSEIVAPTPPAP